MQDGRHVATFQLDTLTGNKYGLDYKKLKQKSGSKLQYEPKWKRMQM